MALTIAGRVLELASRDLAPAVASWGMGAQTRSDTGGVEVLLSPADVSRVLGVPTGTLANWRWARTRPPFLRVGRHVRYRPGDLSDWIEGQIRAAVPDTPSR